MRPRHQKAVQKIIHLYSEKFSVKVMGFANVGNHLHLLLKAQSRRGFQNYLRTITGLIPRAVMNARKGAAQGRFWDGLAYSKLVNFGRHFRSTLNYIFKNKLEALQLIPPRKNARGHLKLDFQKLYFDD